MTLPVPFTCVSVPLPCYSPIVTCLHYLCGIGSRFVLQCISVCRFSVHQSAIRLVFVCCQFSVSFALCVSVVLLCFCCGLGCVLVWFQLGFGAVVVLLLFCLRLVSVCFELRLSIVSELISCRFRMFVAWF